jgi:hypothetical protein
MPENVVGRYNQEDGEHNAMAIASVSLMRAEVRMPKRFRPVNNPAKKMA